MKKKQKKITIGTLSELTDCKIETIRYYEKIGIFPAPPRTEGGHRTYNENHLKRLVFIHRGRELGFSLEDIQALLKLVDEGNYTCDQVQEITFYNLENVRQKIVDLEKLEKILAGISSQGDGGVIPEFPMLDALFEKNKIY